MAWLSRNDFQPSEMLHSDDLNNLANDVRDWGGDVNGGGHRLVNVILDTVGSGVVSSVFGRSGDVNAAPGDYTAAEVTNAVDKTQSYANPAWIASIPWAKITGAPAPPVSTVFGRSGAVVAMGGDYTAAQVTNAVDVTQSYANPSWLASLAYGKLTGAPTIVNSLNSLVGAVVLAAGANITLTPSGNSITIAASGGTSGMTDPTTTKGDLIVHGAGGTTRIGVGSDGQVLQADSTQALGVKWATPATGGNQTPWTSNIDGGNFSLRNAKSITIGQSTQSPSGLFALGTGAREASITYGAPTDVLFNSGTGGDVELAFGQSPTAGSFPYYLQARHSDSTAWSLSLNPLGGNVGIGTLTPSAALDVKAGAGSSIALMLRGNGAGNNTQLHFYGAYSAADLWAIGTDVAAGNNSKDFHCYDLATGPALTIQQGTRNVGVRNVNPLSALHVAGDIAAYSGGQTNSSNPIGASLYLGDAPFANAPYNRYAPGVSAVFGAGSVAADLALYCYDYSVPNRREAMRILSPSGYVGIGTPSPQVLLDLPNPIASNSIARFGSLNLWCNQLLSSGITDNMYYNGGQWVVRNTGGGGLIQFSNGNLWLGTAPTATGGSGVAVSQSIFINPNGYVGVWTTNMGGLFTVNCGNGLLNFRGDQASFGLAAGNGPILQPVSSDQSTTWPLTFFTAGTYFMSGNVGIGTATPQAPLSFGGNLANIKLALYDNGTGSSLYGIGIQSGEMRFTTANGVYKFYTDQASSTPIMTLDTSGGLNVTGGFYVNGVRVVSGGVSAQNDVTASRALATPYHNTTGKPMFVAVTYNFPQGGSITAYTDGAATPGTVVSTQGNSSVQGGTYSVYFWVLPNNYYQVQLSGGQLGNLAKWTEWY